MTPSASGYAYSIVHSFNGGWDGAAPTSGLIVDTAGSLYGTTSAGGSGSGSGLGTAFKLTAFASGYTETVIHRFDIPINGTKPVAALLADPAGGLFGTTFAGGYGYGTVFELLNCR